MPPRKTINASEVAAFGLVVSELLKRVNELSRLNGLPELRVRTVTSVPSEPIEGD